MSAGTMHAPKILGIVSKCELVIFYFSIKKIKSTYVGEHFGIIKTILNSQKLTLLF